MMEFDHDCQVGYGTNHTICYPVVNACSRSVTYPVAHLSAYEDSKLSNQISQAVIHGYEFSVEMFKFESAAVSHVHCRQCLTVHY